MRGFFENLQPMKGRSSCGFVTSAIASAWRASATGVSVEGVTERAAVLAWSGPSRAAYTVLYRPEGARFLSKQLVAHPGVALKGLRPGTPYDVKIIGDNFERSMSFVTTATAAPQAETASEGQPEAPLTELSRLEIRVGKIVECEKHPDADSLYVEKVDVGEEEPRTIVSGLVNFVPLDKMIGRTVVVLCNLKPRAMRGVTSHGMLLCVSNEDRTNVDPLSAPDDAPLGELVTFEGHRSAPIDPSNRATKAFDRIAASLKTSSDGIAMFEDIPFTTSAGPCSSPEKLVGAVS